MLGGNAGPGQLGGRSDEAAVFDPAALVRRVLCLVGTGDQERRSFRVGRQGGEADQRQAVVERSREIATEVREKAAQVSEVRVPAGEHQVDAALGHSTNGAFKI